MHHLVHCPAYIKRFDFLLPLWCMRFEGKHAYFKSVLKSINNFINVPNTLSYRHQQWMSHKITEAKRYMLKFKFVFGKLSCLSLNGGLSYAAKLISYFQIPSTSAIVDCFTSFKINSTTFRINESVLFVPHSIVNPKKARLPFS